MKVRPFGAFGAQLRALREAAGFTQDELATIAGLSVHAVSALERGERRRPHPDTVRALSAALDLNSAARNAFQASARAPACRAAVDELSGGSLPLAPTALLGRDADVQELREWLADPTARLITLIGPGGVGKTRLALELARTIAEDGSTRIIFVPLAAIRNAAYVFNTPNFIPVTQPTAAQGGYTSASFSRVTSAYTDPSNTYDPGGRIGQLMFRYSW